MFFRCRREDRCYLAWQHAIVLLLNVMRAWSKYPDYRDNTHYIQWHKRRDANLFDTIKLTIDSFCYSIFTLNQDICVKIPPLRQRFPVDCWRAISLTRVNLLQCAICQGWPWQRELEALRRNLNVNCGRCVPTSNIKYFHIPIFDWRTLYDVAWNQFIYITQQNSLKIKI